MTSATRFRASQTVKQLIEWRDDDQLTGEGISETCISIAETASLTAYLCEGEPWILEITTPRSALGASIVAALHHLRGTILDKPHVVGQIHKAGLNQKRPESGARIDEALAILVLALDAAPDHLRDMLSKQAGLGRTGDPQGDAQLPSKKISNAVHNLLQLEMPTRGPDFHSQQDMFAVE